MPRHGALRQATHRHKTVLSRAVAYWRADAHDVTNDRLTDLTGHGHHAVLGSANGVDTNDPLMLRYEGEQYLFLSGVANNYASTPDAAAVSPTGDFELRLSLRLDDYTSGEQALITKYTTSGNERSFSWVRTNSGRNALRVSDDGILNEVLLGDIVSLTDGARYDFRVIYTAASSKAEHFHRLHTGLALTDDTGWTAAGAPTGAMTAIFDGSGALEVGGHDGGSLTPTGAIFRALMSIGGTVEFDADFTQQPAPPFATFTEGSSNAATVTINRSATGRKSCVVDRTLALLGTDDFFEVADHPDLDFAADESFTLVYAGRTYDRTPASNEGLMMKRASGESGYLMGNSTGQTGIFGGTHTSFDEKPALTEGAAFVAVTVRDVAADDIEAFIDGVGSGSPITDATTGSLANARSLGIGARLGIAVDNFLDGEFFAAALFREALSDADVRQVGVELGLVPA